MTSVLYWSHFRAYTFQNQKVNTPLYRTYRNRRETACIKASAVLLPRILFEIKKLTRPDFFEKSAFKKPAVNVLRILFKIKKLTPAQNTKNQC